jgi:uncharacterized protein YcbK (DUF882 family)
MGDLSAHFSRSEFACKCGCGFDTVDVQLLEALEAVRQFYGLPVTINSACRCAKYNAKIGGSPKSQHLIGRAADITVRGMSPTAVANYLEQTFPDRYGIGRYSTFVHIDTRATPSRWRS